MKHERFFESNKCPAWLKRDGVCKPIKDFSDSHPNKEHRPLKANGQAGILAKALLRYNSMQRKWSRGVTIGMCSSLLDFLSNSPDRRFREARAWIEREGIEIKSEWEGENPRHQRWTAIYDKDKFSAVRKKLGIK